MAMVVPENMSRYECFYMAKLAQQANYYIDTITFMEKLIINSTSSSPSISELIIDERNPLSTATTKKRKQAAENTIIAYKAVKDIALCELDPTLPTKLVLALNFSIFHHQIEGASNKACSMAREAYEEAIAKLDSLGSKSYKETSLLILQLMRDNLNLWVPLNLWNNTTFTGIGEFLGVVTTIDESTSAITSLICGKIRIATSHMDQINKVINLECNRCLFPIRVCGEQKIVNAACNGKLNHVVLGSSFKSLCPYTKSLCVADSGERPKNGRRGIKDNWTRMGFQRGAIFRAAVATLSFSMSHSSNSLRKRNLACEALATMKLGKSLEIDFGGKDSHVANKIMEIEEKDAERWKLRRTNAEN
ncbi:hypothetical protein TEA_015702 [Camellia sinensis var. sinensis]|uniref:14-3-3 domain-containing protein n=1 Tax=Camellia sinensis var. sinensis TaxID=542762 RepID=A0A4S4D5U0_CAMSN|nr:hypothetical protein TEA_015702 [Camellia sinensis var. sinensis]